MKTSIIFLVLALLSGCAQSPFRKWPLTEPADKALACRLLQASNCAYNVTAENVRGDHIVDLQQCKTFKEIGFSKTQPPVGGEHGGIHAYMAGITDYDEIIIAFRGTVNPEDEKQRKKGIADLVNDIQTTRHQYQYLGEVHWGFFSAAQSVWPSFQELIRKWKSEGKLSNKKLYLTGHSKGGAMALFIALQMHSELLITPTAVYTFEAPRAGTATFWDSYVASKIPTFRYENRGDVVPHLPVNRFEIGLGANVLINPDPFFLSWLAPYISVGQLNYIGWDEIANMHQEDSREFTKERMDNFNKWVETLKKEQLDIGKTLVSRHSILPNKGNIPDKARTYFDVLCPSVKIGKN